MKKDIEYNLSSWKPGSNNVLLVTGLSGGGKSTLAKEMAKKNNALIIEMDMVEYNKDLFNKNWTNMPKGHYIIKEYYEKKYGGPKDWSKISHNEYYKVKCDFIKWFLSYAKSHPDQLFVLEGIQIADSSRDLIKLYKGRPCIIKSTSIPKSMIRRIKRDGIRNALSGENPYKLFEWYIDQYNNIKSFQKGYEENLQEDTIMITTQKILPCFTPREMEELGVFGTAETNLYKVESSQKNIDNWDLYRSTGIVVDDYYTRVREAYEELIKNKTPEAKQNLLELGWNPEVSISSQAINMVNSLTESKLINEGYCLEVMDLTNDNIDKSIK